MSLSVQSPGQPPLGHGAGPPLTDAVRGLPGVERAAGITFVAAWPVGDDGQPFFDSNPFAGADEVFGERLLAGRYARDDSAEFTVNRAGMALLGGEIGQTYQIVGYSTEQMVLANAFDESTPLEMTPIEATLVGEWTSASAFDDPAPQILYSNFLLRDRPEVGVVATLLVAQAKPGVTAEEITAAARQLPGGQDVFEFPAVMVSESTRDALDLQTRALWVVTVVTALAAALVAVQLVIRHLRSTGGDRMPLLALGYRPRQIVGEAAVCGAGIGLLAAFLAALVGVVGSRFFPLGAARQLELEQGPRVDIVVLATVVLGVVVLTTGAAALGAVLATSRTRVRPRRAAVAERLASAGGSPSMVNGVRFALSRQRRRGVPPVAFALGIAIALAGIVGAIVVGASIERVTDTRALYGENFDQLFGNPFVPAADDIVSPIVGDTAVRNVTAATIDTLTIDGEDVAVFSFESAQGSYEPVITSGRAPAAPHEIALGRRVARLFDRDVGDSVDATTPDGQNVELDVVGIAVIPREAGDGAAMTFEGFSRLVPEASKNLVLIDWIGQGTDEDIERISAVALSDEGVLESPTAVIAMGRVTAAPFLLAVVLLGLTLATFVQTLVVTVRERRADLAILLAIGADRRLLRGIVHWHAWTVAIIGIFVSLPLGALVGGRVFALVADDVGVVSSPSRSAGLLAICVVAMLVVSTVIAVWPALRAARPRVGVLRRS